MARIGVGEGPTSDCNGEACLSDPGKTDRSCLLPRERRSPTSSRRQRSARFR